MTNRTTKMCLVLPAAAACLLLAACSGQDRAGGSGAVTPGEDLRRAESLALQAQRAEKEGETQQAIALYQQAAEAYYEFPAVWLNLGRLLLEQGDGVEAATAFRIAADLSPTDPRPVYNLGLLWEERGYNEDASRFYAQALERDENYLDALRGSVYVDRHLLNRSDEVIARRIRRAMLMETEPRWRDFFEREKIRVEEDLRAAGRPIR